MRPLPFEKVLENLAGPARFLVHSLLDHKRFIPANRGMIRPVVFGAGEVRSDAHACLALDDVESLPAYAFYRRNPVKLS
jgi:hypothetical protein